MSNDPVATATAIMIWMLVFIAAFIIIVAITHPPAPSQYDYIREGLRQQMWASAGLG